MTQYRALICGFFIVLFGIFSDKLEAQNVSGIHLESVAYGEVKVQVLDTTGVVRKDIKHLLKVKLNNAEEEILFWEGESILNVSPDFKLCFISLQVDDDIYHRLFYIKRGKFGSTYHDIPLWLSIIPPIIAIMMALIFREVFVSLIIGLWIGAFIINGLNWGLVFKSFLNVFDTYLVAALNNSSHLYVILFSILIGGMIAIISKNGGMLGVVKRLSRFANSRRNTKLVSWMLGISIFFDDYANTLIVGNTMRPITDRFRISREKLAYIVDSTAAPVAAIAFITTWIGAELGYIQDFISTKDNIAESAYGLFFESLAYSYYPYFTLIFMFILIWKGRDFGVMYKAEMRARNTGELTRPLNKKNIEESVNNLEPSKGVPLKARNAVLPIMTVIVGTFAGLIFTGYDASLWSEENGFFKNLSMVIGASDSYISLLWASVLGITMAIGLNLSQKIMSLNETMDALLAGIKNMTAPIAILCLAWSLAKVTNELHTADYLSGVLGNALSPRLLPLIVFILAAFISFSTGSSWGTMAILYPIVLPLTWSMGWLNHLEVQEIINLIIPIISVVLAGSVLGDHCSPISDTTILSSLASQCNHVDHVNTQMPYALTVGGISVLFLCVYYFIDIPFSLAIGIGTLLIYLIIHYFGKKVPEYIPEDK